MESRRDVTPNKVENKESLRILIADDHKDSASSMSMLLRLNGHEVTLVHNGIDALALAKANWPDIVLFELDLPKLNGFELAKELSKNRPRKSPFLIALTIRGSIDDRHRAAEAGVNLHFLKPVEPMVLEKLLARFQKGIDS